MVEEQIFRLLLVEDNPGDADLVIERLSGAGSYRFEVVPATRLSDALVELQSETFDAVILDLNLPDSTGIATLKAARAVRDDVAYIVFSGVFPDQMREQALQAGAQGFIGKNDDSSQLMMQIVRYEIERRSAQDQQNKLQKLVAANPDAMMVIDAAGQVQFVNQAALKLLGEHPDAFGKRMLDLSPKTGQLMEIEVVQDQQRRNAELQVAPLDWDGKPAFLASIRDTTEQRRVEEQIRQAQKIEAIGRMAGGIAHDFNNILMAIGGHADIARNELAPNHRAQKNLTEIERITDRAAEIVRQILTFSRQREVERSVISLQSTVQEAGRFLKATLPANIGLRTQFEPQLPAIMADATQIYQILLNLATNAAHAMRKSGGIVDLRLSSATFGEEASSIAPELRPGRYLCLAVSDAGHGIDPVMLPHIFEPFFTTKPTGEGTGLGLAVVHGIVKDHDGAIAVSSRPGGGTTFSLYFPAVEPGAFETPASAGAPRRGRNEQILYVDDEETIVEMSARALERAGYRVTGFHRPEEALRAFQSDPDRFAAAIVDRSMPRMDGPHLVRELLSLRPDLPIIMITGYSYPEDADILRRLGIRDLLYKPEALKQIVERLHAVLEAPAA